EPILDRDTKLQTLTQLAAARGLPMHATLAVGDGANDLDMLGAAGLGVAFHAKPIVAAAAQFRVDHADLRALLFAQGYRAAEAAGAGRWPFAPSPRVRDGVLARPASLLSGWSYATRPAG